jgi:hypothetical protein
LVGIVINRLSQRCAFTVLRRALPPQRVFAGVATNFINGLLIVGYRLSSLGFHRWWSFGCAAYG